MNRISVIIPVFNRRNRLEEALASVMAQSRPADEIIVVDDGSTDGSHVAAQAFHGVKVIRQANRGVSASRNRGIQEAGGSLLAFLDSDDLWAPDKLLLQEQFMRAHPEIPLCHTDEIWIKNGKRINPKRYHQKQGGFVFLRSLERCLISPSAALLRSELLRQVGSFDENLTVCEDYDLWLRVTALYPVGFLPAPLTIKRGGASDQLSQKFDTMDAFRLIALEKILRAGILPRSVQAATLIIMKKKAEIVLGGFRKRGKGKAATALRTRLEKLQKDLGREFFFI